MSVDCDPYRDQLPDLALGVAASDERDALLAHVTGCAHCASELEQLARVVDTLLLAAPPSEPPAGFESGVLRSFSPATTRRPRWRVLAAAAAFVLALGLAAGLARSREQVPSEGVTAGAPPASSEPIVVLTGALLDPEGRAVGQVVAHDDPSWLTVALDPSAPRGSYVVTCDYEAGDSFTAGSLTITDAGPAVWNATVPIALKDLRRVRVVSSRGGPNLEAAIHPL